MLYFDNLSRDTADVYLADGLTEEITARLGQVGRLVVASRTAAKRFRGAAAMSPAELGGAINAAYLVSGAVRRSGTRLRVTVELLRASSGMQVWASQYDRTQADVLVLQETIAVEVASGIVGRLLPGERARLRVRPTRNRAAYDLYLRGRRAMWGDNRQSLQRAIAAFEEALRLDPGFTAARGRMATAYALMVNWNWTLPGLSQDSLVVRGVAEADSALRQDSSSSDAWLGRGVLLAFREPPDYEAALQALRRSVALDSGNAAAHLFYAVGLRRLGEFAASEQEYRRVLAIEPGIGEPLADLGFISVTLRRSREARALYDSSIAADSSAWSDLTMRARVRLDLGDTAGARADAAQAVRLSPFASRNVALAVLAQILARTGDGAAARSTLAPWLDQRARASGTVPMREGYETALALVALGEQDRALALLARVEPRNAWLWSYLILPWFDAVRADPRFQRLLDDTRPPGARDP